MDRLDRTLAALADPTRPGVVELLRKKPLKSSDLADELAMSRPALSRHLRVLRNAGLLSEEVQQDDARVRLYELCEAPFRELQSWLEEVSAFWGDQLDAFKAHAEKGRRG